jgi:hypothetical protein
MMNEQEFEKIRQANMERLKRVADDIEWLMEQGSITADDIPDGQQMTMEERDLLRRYSVAILKAEVGAKSILRLLLLLSYIEEMNRADQARNN